MKKLFLFAALLMTGFAFYSCDDVVDNPVQDATAEWSYEVSVKFADFKFWYDPTDETTQIKDGVTGEPYLYKAPQTIYVYNMENELLGSLTTSEEIDDLSKSYKFSGKLNGAIGESLIISTLSTSEYAKQDGTLKNIVDNSLILENAVVPVRNYSEAASKVTTANAELQCNTAILRTFITPGINLKAGDKFTFTDQIRTFEYTINDDFDPTNWNEVYIAIPTNGDTEMAYTATTNTEDGYTRGFIIGDENRPLVPGKVNYYGGLPFKKLGVDLTIFDAWDREENGTEGTTYVSTGIDADGTFVITQSGSEALDCAISLWANNNPTDAANITINNIKLKENCNLTLWSATCDVTLIGDNEIGRLNIQTPFTKKGTGSWKYNHLVLGNIDYTIKQDMNLSSLRIENNANITIDENVTVKITSTGNEEPVCIDGATLTLEKGATLNTESKVKDNTVYTLRNNATLNIGEGAKLFAQGGKDNKGMRIEDSAMNLDKNAYVHLWGGIKDLEYGLGQGAIFNHATVTLGEKAKFIAVGMDRQGLKIGTGADNTTTINIAENAEFIAKDSISGNGMVIEGGDVLNITGKGKFITNAKKNTAIVNGSLNLSGGITAEFTQLAGATESAVVVAGTMQIAEDIKEVKVTCTKTTEPICIQDGYGWPLTEMALANLVGTPTNFKDEMNDTGTVRTITPADE
jgi:hypothetical protein